MDVIVPKTYLEQVDYDSRGLPRPKGEHDADNEVYTSDSIGKALRLVDQTTYLEDIIRWVLLLLLLLLPRST